MENQNVESFLQAKIDKARKAYGTANGEGVMAFIHQGEALAEMQAGFEGAGRGKEGFKDAVKNDPQLPPQSTAYALIDIYSGRDKLSTVVDFLPNSVSSLKAMLKYSKEEIEQKFNSGEWDNKTTRDAVQGVVRKETRITNVAVMESESIPNLDQVKTRDLYGSEGLVDQPTLIATGSLQWEEIADLSGISTAELDAAADDYADPLWSVASRLKANRDRLASELAPLAKPERRRVMKALGGILTHEQDVFEAVAKAALPQYNKDLQQRLKNEIGKQKKATADVRNRLNEPFDKADFKFIRGVLHSDREATVERKEKAFDLFMKLAPLYE